MTKALEEETQKCRELESERNEAVDKIKLLRDIIRDLEVKCETKSEEVRNLFEKISKLEYLIEEQERSAHEIRLTDTSKDVSNLTELYKHIEHLETELQQLRVSSELAGGEGVSAQIKAQVCFVYNFV